MVKTNKKLRKKLDVQLCYYLCKEGVHSNRYKAGGKKYSIPLPLLREVGILAEEAGDKTVSDNAWDAFTTGILSGTSVQE